MHVIRPVRVSGKSISVLNFTEDFSETLPKNSEAVSETLVLLYYI